jgi:pimeloyl-ACP methyl ester carboxylesterase
LRCDRGKAADALRKRRRRALIETHRITECRVESGNRAAIIFIHGGGGDPVQTWGRFPQYLAADRRAGGWDVYSYGYVSTGPNKLLGLGAARLVKYLLGVTGDPLVPSLADGFSTALRVEPFKHYGALAIIAHSLGGIITQRMLVDHPDLGLRLRFLFLFGVSSNGFEGWGIDAMMDQIRSIRPGSPLIRDLRDRWRSLYIDRPAPFECWAVAGDQDRFIPRESSLDPFPRERCLVVPGDHESMKDPVDERSRAVQLVLERLSGETLHADRWGSARAAVELGEYQQAIQRLEPHLGELDEEGIVTLALALESVGRSEDALKAVEKVKPDDTDALGVLAGRLKRRWLLYRSRADADKTLEYYSEGYRRASEKGRHDQAYYHGINVAFMQLAYLKDRKAAEETARAVVEHCRQSGPGYWQLATGAEASLYLREFDAAFAGYEKALAEPDVPLRQKQSTYQQAAEIATLMQDRRLVSKLDALFFGQAGALTRASSG